VVIYEVTTFTFKGARGKTDDEKAGDWLLTLQALARLDEYRLVRDGLCSYEHLGICGYAGEVPGYVLEEHLLIENMYAKAEGDRRELYR
jgi:hypothetical protein